MPSKKDAFDKLTTLFSECYSVKVTTEVRNELEKVARERDNVHTGAKKTTHDGIAETIPEHFTGLCGEWAVASRYELPLRLNSSYEDGDPGYDFRAVHVPTEKEIAIDVKTIRHIGGDLLVPTRKADADLYILCELNHSMVGIIGVAPQELVVNSHIERNKFPEECYQVKREKLYTPPEPKNLV